MSDYLTPEWSMVVLFGIHFVAFLFLAITRRTWRYTSTLIAFATLVVMNVFKAVGMGTPALHTGMRVVVFVCLGVTAMLWLRRRKRAKAGP